MVLASFFNLSCRRYEACGFIYLKVIKLSWVIWFSSPSTANFSTFLACLRCALRIVFEVTATVLTTFATSLRSPLAVFCKVSRTTTML
ncbi:Uncharacterised protein [Klebsiella pneumoniae]|uniref:Uncharacterized protein n=1 Tax=Klebsiella pneumoniae TaxID=573 RepID=A0A377TQW6_KLEPN|nr:hypothetical protein LT23_04567 [Klebsiella pneumoniae]CAA0329136.1 Uncharacterised protein [Klebsiella pneumoniae]SAW13634.1 Uncharacterised protein [Klebsiella pneumoniae]SBG50170.1 Uncharacterised protein [Klebsiella pneumoniae]SBJ72027.1 Uncharacterised protein [Klebsiella pneumoniae]